MFSSRYKLFEGQKASESTCACDFSEALMQQSKATYFSYNVF